MHDPSIDGSKGFRLKYSEIFDDIAFICASSE